MQNNEQLKKLFKMIDKLGNDSNNKYYPKIYYTYLSNGFYIHSTMFENYVYGDERNIKEGVLNYLGYSNLPSNFFQNPYYFSVNNMGPENLEKLLSEIRNNNENIPILLVNPIYFLKQNNILYRFTGYVSLDDLYYGVVNDCLYFHSNDCPVINISYFNDKTIIQIEAIKKYMSENYPDTKFSYRIDIISLNELLHLRNILDIIGNSEVILFLADDLFLPENKNPLSARKIVRNSKLLSQIPLEKNVRIFYLDEEYKDLKDIIELEKIIDVILMRIPSSSNDLEKITFITLFLINYLCYDFEQDILRNAYDVFHDKLGVCREFAKILQEFMNRCNIPCELIKADPIIDDEDGHAFNVVTLDGLDYYIDITYLMNEIKDGVITTIANSKNYLTDNKQFDSCHKRSLKYNDYECHTMDREKIDKAIKKVSKWNNNYQISLNNIKDLLRKHDMLMNEQDIINSFPKERGR